MISTTEPPVAATLAALSDFNLERKIRDRLQMINRALAARDDALKAVTNCEKSAVLSAWRLGQHLAEKKLRLGHGNWLPWLKTVGLGERQAQRYLRLAGIRHESNLDGSITKTLARLDHQDAQLQKAALREPDQARLVQEMRAELDQLRDKNDKLAEREAIMFESATPEVRAKIDKYFAQAEQIRELRAARDGHMTEHAQLMREKRALKLRKRSLDKQIAELPTMAAGAA